MGRWRTLYEVTTVATLISEWGPLAAERYIAHEIVESKRAMEEFEKCAPFLGQRPMSERQKQTVLQQYDRAIIKYGKEFGTPNGWASAFMSNKQPKFNHLEEAAQQAWMRSYYKMASYPVHAGIKGILFRLGTLDDRHTILAGASNAGFADPLERIAVSLVQLTMLLLKPHETVDDLIILRCFVDLRDQITRNALDAHHALVRDDRAYRTTQAASKKPRPQIEAEIVKSEDTST